MLPDFSISERRIATAVAASLLVHALALLLLPGMHQPTAAPALQVALPPPVKHEIVAQLVPPAMEAAPRPSRRPTPAQNTAPQPQPLTLPAEQATANTPVLLAVPPPRLTTEAPPRPLVRSEPPPPDAAALGAYGRDLAGSVAQRQRYPRIAQLRQWQGSVMLQLDLAADGRLLDVRVVSSSGHEVLDRQAQDMVRAAVPFPPLPATLAGRPLTVDIPVVFRLASP